MITFEKTQAKTIYNVVFENGVKLGEAYMEVDGYYVFWPDDTTNGFWASHVLRAIADKLDEINREWDEVVRNDLSIGGPV